MTIGSKKESIILFLGDIISLTVAFWLALALRAGEVPSFIIIQAHAPALALLSFFWVITFFIIGLYDRRVVVSEKEILGTIVRAQVINSAIAVLFFYLFTPYLGIAPKTILALSVGISTALIVLWRLFEPIVAGSARAEPALIIGSGEEMGALMNEVNARPHYSIRFVSSIDLDHIDDMSNIRDEITRLMTDKHISSIVVYLRHEKAGKILPVLYGLIFSGIRFYDMHKVYEEVFERIPLSIVRHSWFLENISSSAHAGYDFLKRAMDISLSSMLGLASLVAYPFVYLAIKLDDGGPLLISQERIGTGGKIIHLYKFRSMSRNETDLSRGGENKVTRVGNFLRKTRLDEVPQLWNVLRGDLSLIGPRPELPSGVAIYEKEIPYYHIRHLIKPGLSGWAQLYHERHPHHGVDIEETRNKLSYDLFYVKNRSLALDVIIALKTINVLLSRKGA